MNDLLIAEERIVSESPVHGPEIMAELARLRTRETELLKSWAADDNEARVLRFALHDIEAAARAEGRPAIAQMAAEARGKTAERASQIKDLLDALATWDANGPMDWRLEKTYAPFRCLKTNQEEVPF